MFQTISPFAIKYNLAINTSYDVNDVDQLVKKIKKASGTVLIVWEHKEMPVIAELLGVKTDNLKWDSDDYDSIWVVNISDSKAILTKDKEGIKPASTCPF